MKSHFYNGINWEQAWFGSVRQQATELLAAGEWRNFLNGQAARQQLSNHRGLPLQFIAQEQLPEGTAYEAHISASGQVPTRENLHDFFNALVWLTFPKIKRQLNALQAAQIAALGIGKSRGPARDAATIFDENAALLVVEDSARGQALIAALHAHEWQTAFVTQASLFGAAAEVWSFGHALMEKLVHPYKAITAHTWLVFAEPEFFSWGWDQRRAWLDTQVAEQLRTHSLSTADYSPLPVLGIPGWWPQQDAAFYADTSVFRAKRKA